MKRTIGQHTQRDFPKEETQSALWIDMGRRSSQHSPSLMKTMNPQMQDAQSAPSKRKSKKTQKHNAQNQRQRESSYNSLRDEQSPCEGAVQRRQHISPLN
jgi:hypothetical protein